MNNTASQNFLAGHGFPLGIQNSMTKNLARLPTRFVIVDDSGSMLNDDGRKIRNQTEVPCSRWDELGDSLRFAANFAQESQCLTEFRMLNGCDPILVGADDDTENKESFLEMLEEAPGGETPLCRHVTEVIESIKVMEKELKKSRQKAVIVIATDGEASDGDLVEAMAPLRTLPVWIVIRLCTSEQAIVDYWNNIDKQLEVEMDVLDDYISEAAEVRRFNPWFSYGLALHRMREFGVRQRELDLLDEKKLSPDQIVTVCQVIFGGEKQQYPCPQTHPNDFKKFIKNCNEKESPVWDPLLKKMSTWVNMDRVK